MRVCALKSSQHLPLQSLSLLRGLPQHTKLPRPDHT
jgi:hypothetical protein